jgi:hypothetical protein
MQQPTPRPRSETPITPRNGRMVGANAEINPSVPISGPPTPLTPRGGQSRPTVPAPSPCMDADVLLLHARLLKNDKKGSPQTGGHAKTSPFKPVNTGVYGQEVMAVV